MGRYGRLAAASVVSLLLVTGCSAGGLRPHDKLTCRRFASAVSVVDSSGINATDLFARAVTVGRVAARRPGYLSARLARNRLLSADGATAGVCPSRYHLATFAAAGPRICVRRAERIGNGYGQCAGRRRVAARFGQVADRETDPCRLDRIGIHRRVGCAKLRGQDRVPTRAFHRPILPRRAFRAEPIPNAPRPHVKSESA